MKINKISLGVLVMLSAVIFSCRDFVEPRIPYSEFDTGLYLRTVERTSTSFNFFNLANGRFALTLEAVDAEEGTTLESVEIRVRHRRLIPGVGLEYTPAESGGEVVDELVKTLPASAFGPHAENRFKRGSFEITAAEAIEAVGLTMADIEGGDTFEFRLYARDRFGRIFGPDNRSSDIAGGEFYQSPFLYNVNVVCPTDLGGTYNYISTEMSSGFGSCPGEITGTVTLTPIASSTAYTVSDGTFGFWNCYGDNWGSGNVRLNDACGILSFAGTDKYGDGYTFTFVSNDGTNLVFIWANASGETGRVTLIANEGETWPEGLR